MADTLERELTARLGDVGATVPAELDPPRDLELQVARRRKRKARLTTVTGLAVAASLVAAVALFAVIERAPVNRRVGVSTSPPSAQELIAKTVLLDARGQWAVGLDAGGHQVITLATSHSGNIVQAQLTEDHKTLWYLSVAGKAGVDCGNLVRADIASGDSWVVEQAVAFAVSPDGTRLALSGGGACAPAAGKQLVVRDLVTNESATAALTTVPTFITWSPSGDRVVAGACTGDECGALHAFDVPRRLPSSLADRAVYAKGRAVYGTDGLYVVSGPDVVRLDLATLQDRTTIAAGAPLPLVQVVPTARGLYAVTRSTTGGAADGLSLVESGRLVPVRTFAAGFGTFTPVWQPR